MRNLLHRIPVGITETTPEGKGQHVFRQVTGEIVRHVAGQDHTQLSQVFELLTTHQLPGSITKDGQPIAGGDRINANDAAFIATIYPKQAPPVITPPVGASSTEFVLGGKRYRIQEVT